MINAVLIHEKDVVATAIEEISKGEEVNYNDCDGKLMGIIALNDIKIYHKIAVTDIDSGSFVIKYGEHIGMASKNIKAGEHVHEHNVKNVREDLYVE